MQRKWWIILILFLFLGGIFWYIGKQHDKIKDLERNVNAYQTEMVQIKDKNNQLISINDVYQIKISDLENTINIKEKELKSIQKTLDAKIKYISQIESEVKLDTIIIENEVVKDDSINIYNFNWKDDWVTILGSTRVTYDNTETTLYTLKFNTPLTVGLTDDYKIFAKSDNPYLYITSLEGAQLEPNIFNKKYEFNWSLQIGFGLTYGLLNKALDLGPTMSWGFNITF
jgi:hypothetical protein